MKNTKRIAALVLTLVLVLSFAACSLAEKTVVLRGDLTEDMAGIPTTDTWTLNAKGDIVKTLNEVYTFDFTDFDEESKAYDIELIASILVDPAKGIAGVECSDRMDGDTYVVELTIDCNSDTVNAAVEAGLLALESGSSATIISLKQTISSLESQGYEVVE